MLNRVATSGHRRQDWPFFIFICLLASSACFGSLSTLATAASMIWMVLLLGGHS